MRRVWWSSEGVSEIVAERTENERGKCVQEKIMKI